MSKNCQINFNNCPLNEGKKQSDVFITPATSFIHSLKEWHWIQEGAQIFSLQSGH